MIDIDIRHSQNRLIIIMLYVITLKQSKDAPKTSLRKKS